jgi:RNA polymerase sigma-70 factor, ECF subfamily
VNSSRRPAAIFHSLVQESNEYEEHLVLAAKAGSHAAFAELQRTYSHRLYKRIYTMVRNREDAEDALQDTFFRAYTALPLFEGRCKISSWLTRIAINSALMIMRKRRIRPETSFELQQSLGDDTLYLDVPDDAMNPEQACDQSQRSQALLLAIQRLDPKLRVPLGIWISQEHSMRELAQQLGISLASLKARLHRARKRLSRSPILRNDETHFVRADSAVERGTSEARPA